VEIPKVVRKVTIRPDGPPLRAVKVNGDRTKCEPNASVQGPLERKVVPKKPIASKKQQPTVAKKPTKEITLRRESGPVAKVTASHEEKTVVDSKLPDVIPGKYLVTTNKNY